jgi:hypothetical protein
VCYLELGAPVAGKDDGSGLGRRDGVLRPGSFAINREIRDVFAVVMAQDEAA